MKKRTAQTERILASSRAVRGIMRQEHFAANGTTAMWRGTRSVTPNHKAKAKATACRKGNW